MANPTLYQSLHGDFGSAIGDSEGYYLMPEVTYPGQLQQFRVFIPPGTMYISLEIYHGGYKQAVVRHKIPPTTFTIPLTPTPDARTLTQLIQNDQIIFTTEDGKHIFIDDTIISPGIPSSMAGWLYAYVTYSNVVPYTHSFQIGVNADIYNDWRDKTDWQEDVEDLETYGVDPIDHSEPTPVNWAATETSDWLTITSGASGTDAGEIVCDYTENTLLPTRTGTIKITNSDTQKLLASVTVTQSNTDIAPITISTAKTIVTAMASRLSSVSQAKKNVTQMLTGLDDIKSAIESGLSAAAKALISANPVAKTINYFMMNKVAGSFGSYGIVSQIDKLTAMQNAMEQEMDFCKTAISMYNQIDKGATSLLGIDSLSSIPGFDSSTYPNGFDDTMTIDDYHPDMDHPKSKNMLAKASDLRMIDRPGENPDDAITPDNPEIGDLICIYGIVYIYTNDPEDDSDQLWYPLGIQELCQITSGKAKYDKTHTKTESVEKPAEEVGYMYEPFCKVDPTETT